jgi:hypothetical protein
MATGCDAGSTANPDVVQRPLEAIDDSTFAGLVERVSEEGGFFDTDNLISNESGYLKVMGALEDSGLRGGGYVGVGPDQNFSYIAVLRPEIAFITDVRRDNMLHHLLLKALMERAATRVEFLAGLHGRSPPVDPLAWRSRPIDDIAVWIDGERREIWPRSGVFTRRSSTRAWGSASPASVARRGPIIPRIGSWSWKRTSPANGRRISPLPNRTGW